jgi:predicted nuclease of predicted toxin-antitoxin system
MLRFLADVNVEKKLVDFLKNEGYDVLWIPDYDCSIKDNELLDLANQEHRVLITNDKDFSELVFLQKKVSMGIILIRIKGQQVAKKLHSLRKLLKFHADKIENHFIVVSERRIRIRILEEIK